MTLTTTSAATAPAPLEAIEAAIGIKSIFSFDFAETSMFLAFNIFEEDEIKGEFKKIPIEKGNKEEVEVYQMYSYNNLSYAKNKIRKKMIKYALIGILAIIALYITKRFLSDGLKELFYEDDNNN